MTINLQELYDEGEAPVKLEEKPTFEAFIEKELGQPFDKWLRELYSGNARADKMLSRLAKTFIKYVDSLGLNKTTVED